jgi:formylmethanofuran dehydrogenase subunit E
MFLWKRNTSRVDFYILNDTRAEIEKMIEYNDLAGLLHKTAQIHGHHCVGSAMGVIGAHYAMKTMGVVQNTGMEHLIAVVETNNCFSDGVQMVTGCSFGNNSLVYRDYGKTAFSLVKRSGEGVRVSVRPDLGDLLKNKNSEAQRLYIQTVNQREATPDEEDRMMELNKLHCFDVLNIPAERIFRLEHVSVEIPSYSRILASQVCAKCGEKIMETKAVKKGDTYYCKACGEGSYGQLDWAGIHWVEKDRGN